MNTNRITASVCTDDHLESCIIDVTPFFENLQETGKVEAYVEKLSSTGWHCNDKVDEAVYFILDHSDSHSDARAELGNIFAHINEQNRNGEDIGFQCTIDQDEFDSWKLGSKE